MQNNKNSKPLIKALFTDLDGTLLYKNKISKENIKTCKKLVEAGIPVIFTTGRDLSSCKYFLEVTGIGKIPGYCICLCGALIYKLPEMELIYSSPIIKNLLEKFLNDCASRKISMCLYTKDNLLIYKKSLFHYFLSRTFSCSNLPIKPYFKKNNEPCKLDIYKVILYFPWSILNANKYITKLHNVKDDYKNHFGFYMSNVFATEVINNSVNKGMAIKFVIKKMNLNLNEIAYIGDANNDVPAFEKAGYKIALSNAIPELISQANFVSLHAKKNGFSFAINKLFFEPK